MGRDSYGEVTLAFLLGAVVGSAVALLYAPASGAATRRQLAEAAARLRANSEEKYDQARGYVTDKIDQGRSYVTEKIDQGKSYVQDRKEEIGAAVNAGKDAYRHTKEQH